MLRPLFASFVLFAWVACADDDGSDLPFDGNFIVGDGAPADPPADAGPAELGPRPDADAEGPDASSDDAEPDLDLGAGLADADAGDDPCRVTPELTLTASAAVARAAELAGRVVEVRGRLEAGPTTCTERACSVEAPCCNTCTAPLAVDGLLEVGPSDCLEPVGCRGDECGLVCRPAPLGAVERFVGRLSGEPPGSSRLELIEVRRP